MFLLFTLVLLLSNRKRTPQNLAQLVPGGAQEAEISRTVSPTHLQSCGKIRGLTGCY